MFAGESSPGRGASRNFRQPLATFPLPRALFFVRFLVAPRGLVGVRVHARKIPDKRAGVPRPRRGDFFRRKRGRAGRGRRRGPRFFIFLHAAIISLRGIAARNIASQCFDCCIAFRGTRNWSNMAASSRVGLINLDARDARRWRHWSQLEI